MICMKSGLFVRKKAFENITKSYHRLPQIAGNRGQFWKIVLGAVPPPPTPSFWVIMKMISDCPRLQEIVVNLFSLGVVPPPTVGGL